MWRELIIWIVTVRSICHNSSADIFVLENLNRKFAIIVAPPADGSTKRLVHCKAHLSLLNRWLKLRPNRLATRSFLRVPRNWRKRAVRNLAVCCGAIWRRREKPKYGCTQSHSCTTAPKIFRKIYTLYDFRCAQTCSFWAIFGLPIRTSAIAASAI